MAVPRNRLSNARKNSKRAHHAKKPKSMGSCSRCGSLKVSHIICPKCGDYNGEVVIAQEAKE